MLLRNVPVDLLRTIFLQNIPKNIVLEALTPYTCHTSCSKGHEPVLGSDNVIIQNRAKATAKRATNYHAAFSKHVERSIHP